MIGSSSRQPNVMRTEDGSSSLETSMGGQCDTGGIKFLGSGEYFTQDPCLGMTFNSYEDAYHFYNEYARRKGFGTRKGNSERSRVDNSVISRKILCCKAGRNQKYPEREDRVQREKEETRVGCKAHIIVKRRREGEKLFWVLDRFEENHSHEFLSPVETSNLRSHRRFDRSPVPGEYSTQEPYLGMRFNSHEEACQFYNEYARRKGFGTRKGNSERSRIDNSVISKKFLCCKEGVRSKKYSEREDRVREHDETRVGCKAHLMVKRRREGEKEFWVVDRFEENHNHELLSPGKTSTLRSHRSSNKVSATVIDSMQVVPVPKSQICRDIAHGFDGVQNVPFNQRAIDSMQVVPAPKSQIYHDIAHGFDGVKNVPSNQRDMHNNIGASRSSALGAQDAQAVVRYCNDMQSKNCNLFHSIDVDSKGCISHFFWVDALSIMAYKKFGDIVSFDTTYRTNVDDMPFAIFTGVNHHRQTILFGAALLCDETETSLSWLFRTWLRAMSGKPPNVILTDQDDAMAKAIACVLPTSVHHLCRWHALKNFPEKLGHVCKEHVNFEGEFEKCYRDSKMIDEFETHWLALINKYDLQQNEWLKSLYEIRHKWIPAYTQRLFTGGMSTAQRSESMTAFFGSYLRRRMTLQEFVRSFDEALEHRYHQESEADSKNLISKPMVKMSSPMLHQVAPLYTRANYLLFEKEIEKLFEYIMEEVEVDGLEKLYRVKNFKKESNQWHFVKFTASDAEASCSCLKFESEGILCRHALRVMVMNNVMSIPSQYILERWILDMRTKVVYDSGAIPLKADWRKSETLRYNDLFQRARQCAEEATAPIDIYDAACSCMKRCFEEIVAAKKSIVEGKLISTPSSGSIQGDNENLGSQTGVTARDIPNPLIVNAKGHSRSSGSRIEGHLEKRSKKSCTVCRGHDHNAGTCPQLKGSRSTQSPQSYCHPNIQHNL
ncbi:protein FAR1-RELATED SEQUENCE 5-like [Tasmannia lanceolata]|uniref:protein FAR1-RELATED SEQUENCE 5-like n=1 Tax=Tasmannia lanceolata TaxID=3420 RepID=UPI004062A2E0